MAPTRYEATRYELRGGPADGGWLYHVRPRAPATPLVNVGVRVGSAGPSFDYEFDPDAKGPPSCVYSGVAAAADDAEEVAALDQWAAARVDFTQSDGTPASLTRMVFRGGPDDGAEVLLVYTRGLTLAGLTVERRARGGSLPSYLLAGSGRGAAGLGTCDLLFEYAGRQEPEEPEGDEGGGG